jgi:ribosomal protein S18 acetylase RimI-like enzyme
MQRLYAFARAAFADLPGWKDDRVLDVLNHDRLFVAREHEEPAGYVALHHDADTATIVVDQLFVAPGHEGRGIGHRLLAFAEGYAIAERAGALRVVAERDNWRAQSFYRRSGFVAVEHEMLELVLPQLD